MARQSDPFLGARVFPRADALSLAGVQFGFLFGGTLLVEIIYSYPNFRLPAADRAGFVRSWPKLTCERSGGIRVLTHLGHGRPVLLCCTTALTMW